MKFAIKSTVDMKTFRQLISRWKNDQKFRANRTQFVIVRWATDRLYSKGCDRT